MGTTQKMRAPDSKLTLQDKLLELKMDECIVEATQYYEGMKFQMAIKCAFSDLRNARKVYRDYHEKCSLGYHPAVIERYCRTIVILCSPILKHWSEYIWTNVFKEEPSLFSNQRESSIWPAVSNLPKELVLQDTYLNDLITSFRNTIQK